VELFNKPFLTMKIYIAGKISGLLKEEYLPKFEKAETELRAAGWEPVNPCKLGIPDHATTEQALPVCIKELEKCQAVYMLSDWRDSLGAIVEHSTAKHLRKDVFYEEYHPIGHMENIKNEVL
jgi:hypothetical protein